MAPRGLAAAAAVLGLLLAGRSPLFAAPQEVMPPRAGAAHDVARAVTEADVAAYRRDGFVHLRGAFGPEWLGRVREAFAESMEKPSPYAEVVPEEVEVMWWNPFAQQDSHRQSRHSWGDFMDFVFYEHGSGRTPTWDTVVSDSPAAAIIAGLMGSATAAFFYGQLILKRGGAGRVIPWHQDLPYWKIEGSQIGTVWVALDDMPAEAGVRYIPGSHRWPCEARQCVDVSKAQAAEAVSFAVAAGDAVCFDARVVHGSPGNPEGPSSSHRRVALRFGGDDAVYWQRDGHTPIPVAEVDRAHGLRHGEPIACAHFPRVYADAQP